MAGPRFSLYDLLLTTLLCGYACGLAVAGSRHDLATPVIRYLMTFYLPLSPILIWGLFLGPLVALGLIIFAVVRLESPKLLLIASLIMSFAGYLAPWTGSETLWHAAETLSLGSLPVLAAWLIQLAVVRPPLTPRLCWTAAGAIAVNLLLPLSFAAVHIIAEA